MRLHPISLALMFLKGRKSVHGRVVFENVEEAVDALRKSTGQDFGTDAVAWGRWLRANRWVYFSGPISVCDVHGCQMVPRPIKIIYGLRRSRKQSPAYLQARSQLFPNCDDEVNGGSILRAAKSTRRPVCPECVNARNRYMG